MKNKKKEKGGNGYACRLVFFISLAFAYLIVPQAVFGQYAALSIIFFLTFAYTMACVAHTARENAKNAAGKGAVSVLASAAGLAALDACGAAACGSIGVGIFSLALSIAVVHFFAQYGAYLVAACIAAQLFSLWKMGCLNAKAALKIASG